MYTPTNFSSSSFSYGRRPAISLHTHQPIRRMKVYYLMDYLPTRFSATSEQARDRRAIYDFKDGSCPARIINGLAEGIRKIADANTVVCFVPASTQYKTLQRYGSVSSRLEALTGKRCSYTAITKPEDAIVVMQSLIGDMANEYFAAVYLNTKNKPLDFMIANIAGHVHADRVGVSDGVLCVTTTCEAALDTSVRNTDITRHAFDVFMVDKENKYLSAVRIGYGSNRKFSYDAADIGPVS